MGVYSYGARLSRADVVDLNTASDRLAAAASAIRRANPVWGEACVTLLIEANQIVVRIHNKGAGTFARYIAKHGPQAVQDAPGEAPAGLQSPTGDRTAPDRAEG